MAQLRWPKLSDAAATAAAIGITAATELLASERNIAKIGEYTFSMDKGVLDEIQRSRTFGFSKVQPVGSNPTYQAVGGVEDTFSVSGHFILKSVKAFNDFVSKAAEKKPMSFVAGNSGMYGTVIVLEISEGRKQLLDNGAHVRLDFSMKLAVVPE